jgi:hypothetical protein
LSQTAKAERRSWILPRDDFERLLLAQSGRKPGVTARLIRPRIGSNLVIAVANEVVHNGGHKTKAGPLMKPYFIGFLGFPVPTAENPSLSASLKPLFAFPPRKTLV